MKERKEKHLNMLKGWTIEDRLASIEEWIWEQEHKPLPERSDGLLR